MDEVQDSGDTEHSAESGDETTEFTSRSEDDSKALSSGVTTETQSSEGEHAVVESDSSEDERPRNPVGKIPMKWYEEYPHIGYNLDGKKIMKKPKKDKIDAFIDPLAWRTVYDEVNDEEIVLSKDEINTIRRIHRQEFPDANFDPYEVMPEFDYPDGKIHPLSQAPEPKSRFIPSKGEAKKIIRMVRAIRNGWVKAAQDRDEKRKKPDVYDLWDAEDASAPLTQTARARALMHIAAPKAKLPGHAESYNPPEEYLPTAEELEAWSKLDPEDRPYNFVPTKSGSLRLVPLYKNGIKEQFERCLDLYLCPRVRRLRQQVDPESLIPRLPKPRELQPFPNALAVRYIGHQQRVRSISVDPTGEYLASGSDDGTLRLWEVATGYCLHSWPVGSVVYCVAWNPNPALCLLALAVDDRLVLFSPGVGSDGQNEATRAILQSGASSSADKSSVRWEESSAAAAREDLQGPLLTIHHPKAVKHIAWHHKGDYLASLSGEGTASGVLVHQVSRRGSQNPFKKGAGRVQRVLFHPSKPLFLVATQHYVRIYNLVKQQLAKKLQSGVKWISSLDIHPSGDHVIIGSYDKRLCWFDLDLSPKPYRVLRYHEYAVRQVAFHPRYPLFASASDDATLHVFHGMVYSDLTQNPLIVPLKVLKSHTRQDNLGVMDVCFHPLQPWVFSAGADHTITLFANH